MATRGDTIVAVDGAAVAILTFSGGCQRCC
jgi:hypothetical protein